MAVVNNQHAQGNAASGEVVLHELAPPVLFRLGNLGKAIARQVHQIALPVQKKIVDVDGLSRLIPYLGHALALKEPIDNGGLAYVGLSGKGNFRQPISGEILRCGGRNKKFHILKIHSDLLTAGFPGGGLCRTPLPGWYPEWWGTLPQDDSGPHPAQYPQWRH